MGVAVRTGRLPVEFSSQRSVVYAYVAEIELLDSKGIGGDDGFDIAEAGVDGAEFENEWIIPRALQELSDPSMTEMSGDLSP